MDRGAWQSTVHGIARVGHDLALFLFFDREDFQECTSYCSQNVLFYLFKFPRYKECIKIYLSISLICIIEDPLEKETATHSSILALEITCAGEPGRLWGHKELD